MSTKEHHGHASGQRPFHATVTFEGRDINIGTIARYLVYLAITIGVALALCIPMMKVFTDLAAQNDTPVPPVRAAMNQKQMEQQMMPMEPRLQGVPGHESDPQSDMREKVKNDNEANNTYGWVDKDKGIAQIPVAEAMKIIAAKGAVPAAAATEKKQ